MLSKVIVSVLSLAGTTLAAPTTQHQSRAVVAHDSLNPIPTRVQAGANGELISAHVPRLHLASGCEVYTAVDDEGNTSGGLQDTGDRRGGCRDTSKGQTYARIGEFNGQTAIMYAWYWPKDQTTDGDVAGGHRHDWENVVIWFDADNNIVGGSASGHGEYKKHQNAPPGGANPQVEYFNTFPTNQELQFTDTATGAILAVSDWDAMPQVARDALETADFGSANVPFKDATFQGNLEKAAV